VLDRDAFDFRCGSDPIRGRQLSDPLAVLKLELSLGFNKPIVRGLLRPEVPQDDDPCFPGVVYQDQVSCENWEKRSGSGDEIDVPLAHIRVWLANIVGQQDINLSDRLWADD